MKFPILFLLCGVISTAQAAALAAEPIRARYTIIADNGSDVAHHSANRDTAQHLLVTANDLLRKSTQLAESRANKAKEMRQHSDALAALEKRSRAEFGSLDSKRPLAVCGMVAAELNNHWEAVLADDFSRIAHAKDYFNESVVTCKRMLANPPALALTVAGPPGGAGPGQGCRELYISDKQQATKQSLWQCPPQIRL